MIPFPGESIGLSYTDGVNFDSIWLRGGRGGQPPTATITAGDEWRCWVDPGTQNYLEDDATPVTVSWVVEAVSGSGTLHALWGVDPMYGDPSLTPSNDAGSQAVTGAQTVVFTTTLTAADVRGAAGSLMLLLTCTSGSVEVQQVKMRVWPPEGVAGGWVDMPAWDTEPNLVYAVGAFVGRGTVDHAGEREAAWNAAAADSASGGAGGAEGPHAVDLVTSVAPRVTIAGVTRQTVIPASGAPRITMATSLDGTNAVVNFYPNGVLARLSGSNPDEWSPIAPGKVEGVDWVIPPEEVPGEAYDHIARWTGERAREWVNAAATVVVGAEYDETFHVGAFMVGVSMAQWTTSSDPISGTGFSMEFNANMVDGPVVAPSDLAETVTQVPIAAGDDFTVLSFGHAMATTLIPWPGYPPFTGDAGGRETNWTAHLGVGDPSSASFQPMADIVHLPPYQVWSPTAVQKSPHLIFWRHDDLGAGASMVFQPGTRQATGIVFANN